MAMTKKFFQRMADTLAGSAGLVMPLCDYQHLVRQVGLILAEDSPRFDIGRFEGACMAARTLEVAKLDANAARKYIEKFDETPR